MRIVVSGGAGFLGSHLCGRLLHEGHEVFCIDSFISGNAKNIREFEKNPAFHLISNDVTLPFTGPIAAIDQIYHLAGATAPNDCLEIPLQVLWTSAAGTKLMMELANKNMAPILLASSSAVYSGPEHEPQAEGKRFAEALAMNYYRHYRFPLKIARIFETYGPRMRRRSGSVPTDLIDSALRGEPLRIFGDGSQKLALCYVDDMVDGLWRLMNHGGFLEVLDLGNPFQISESELAKKIIALSGSASLVSLMQNDLKAQDGVGNGMPDTIPDLTLAREKLGFEPKIGLDEGLRKTIASML